MEKPIRSIVALMIFTLTIAACSLNSTAYLSQSYDNTFTTVSKPLSVPSTATTVTLSGTASVNGTNTLGIYVLGPDNSIQPPAKTITGDGTGASQNINGSWPAQAGTWTLRVVATGASGNFNLTLAYQ